MRLFYYLAIISLLSLSACKTSTNDAAAAKPKPGPPEADKGPDLAFLLSMSFEEASAISPAKLVVPPFVSVAADSIEVLSKKADGTPRRVRAKGHVFLQVTLGEEAHALCQEALISGDEIILRGRPILKRGASTVEGLSDSTVFFMLGMKLRTLGLHKVTTQSEMAASSDRGPWENAANPLLPPLEEGAVPSSVRDELRKATEAETLHQQTLKAAPAPPMTAPP
jgi:hypothetical protein